MTALRLSMIGGLLALLSSVVAASTVYLVLVSVSGLAVVIPCASSNSGHPTGYGQADHRVSEQR